VTNPEIPPVLLWEFKDNNLGYTTSYPAVVYAGPSTWAIAFGSGPTDYDGISSQSAKTYVVNLVTGAQVGALATSAGGGAFMGDPISVDLDIADSQCTGGSCDYSSDLVYIGNSEGKLYRIKDMTSVSAGAASVFVDLNNANKPITSAPSASRDNDGRLWLYFGTGRFFDTDDKVATYTQTVVGAKEPIDNAANLTYGTVVSSGLLSVTDYEVYEGGYVDKDGDDVSDARFSELVNEIKQKDGWAVNLALWAGERCITKPVILGGILTFSTYAPEADICSYEGDSYLYALYYKTGTAYYEDVIGHDDEPLDTGAGTATLKNFKESVSLGYGLSASPSLHVGKRKGARVLLQTSTGEIVEVVEQNLPEGYRSRPLNWRQPH
jgi:type IV pilus assembly protein PilY1